MRAHALVLAAGQGRRFGGDKLLALYRGRPLLSYVLELVAAGCERGVLGGGHVVVGRGDDAARRLAENASLETIINDAPHLGLSHSLRLGLADLEQRPSSDVGAALVFLGDQPLVRLAVMEALIAAGRARTGRIVRPRYQMRPDVPGHPVLLDRSIWPLASRLRGDRGFATLLDSVAFPIVTLDVPGDNPDVDTRADLLALEESSP